MSDAPGDAAAAWDRLYDGRNADAHRVRSRLEATVQLLGPGPGDLLDVGAGAGRLLDAAARRGWTGRGVDASERVVALAGERAAVTVGRAEHLPFADESFDAVTMLGMLEHVDVDEALAEARRVLRPGGRAIVGVRSCRAPATMWQESVVRPIARGLHRPVAAPALAVSLEDALAAIERAGLVVEKIVPVGVQVLADPLDRWLPRVAYGAAIRAERSPRLLPRLATQRLVIARRP